MNIKELILSKYESIDNMLDSTELNISRSYLYQIINGDKDNISIEVAKPLADALDITVDELIRILNETKKI
jgi:transcriptional regulator with XRE-family HTH domain